MKRIIITIILSATITALPTLARKITLNILHTSDTHSRIEPIPAKSTDKYANRGGVARRDNIIRSERKKDAQTLVFDCGDFCQGTPYYNMFKGDVEVTMLNKLKYNAVTIGNHEFDFGTENMARIYRKLKCPVLCANYTTKNTPLDGLVKPYVILRRHGLKIGIFGLGAQLDGLVQAEKYGNMTYLDPVPVAQKTADFLKNKKKCNLIICLSHLGYSNNPQSGDNRLITQTSGIDLLLGGHSHTYLDSLVYFKNKNGKPIPILHTGKNGVNIGKIQLTISKGK